MALLDRIAIEGREEETLDPVASRARNSGGRREPEGEDPLRTAFQRDRDRVIHCAAFRRLQHKTQVIAAYTGDHHRSRMTHSLEVAQMSRGVARSLQLNGDLAEAVALAHDLGHPPFGHSGEEVLDELMTAHGGFRHNAQGVRIVDLLEDRNGDGLGLNLSFATRKSLLKGKVPKDFPLSEDLEPEQLLPIEAQAVDQCDKIAYLCHDLEDGLQADILQLEEVATLRLWQQASARLEHPRPSRIISEITAIMIHDLVQATDAQWSAEAPDPNRARVQHSGDMRVLADELLSFLRQHFYQSEDVLRVMREGRDRIRQSFAHFLNHQHELPSTLASKVKERGLERCVCDYISGMTDRYLLKESR